jgi:FkbM family methyltransferase
MRIDAIMKKLIWLKKLVTPLIINNISGRIIKSIYKDTGIPFRGIKIYIPDTISPEIAAMLYWEAYESAEIRFVNKYLNPKTDVIEIGSSIGGVSCQIGKRLDKDSKLICVEANPTLIETLNRNLKINNISATIVNKAIGQDELIHFQVSENNLISHERKRIPTTDLESRILKLETIQLSKLLNENNITVYNLVCDIEGAEINLILEEPEAFKNIQSIIIELHTTQYNNKIYQVPDLVNLIHALDFRTVDVYGNVYFFKKI